MKTALARTRDRGAARRSLSRLLIAWAAIVVACLVARAASAQVSQSPQVTGDYYVGDLGDWAEDSNMRSLMGQVRTALTERESLTDRQKRTLAGYFGKVLVLRMSQPEAAAQLTELVHETVDLLNRAARSGTEQAYNTSLSAVRNAAIKVVMQAPDAESDALKGKYFSPRARIAAVILLGRLDMQPGGSQAPIPDYMRTSGVLRTVLNDAAAPVGLRLAALAGFHRHATLLGPTSASGGAQQQRLDAVKKFYVSLAQPILADQGPAGLTSAELGARVHAFVQRYAIDMIAAAGTEDDKKALVQQLNEIVTDTARHPLVAIHAAETLSRLGDALDALEVNTDVVIGWGERTLVSLEQELDRLAALQRPSPVVGQQIFARPPEDERGRGNNGGYGSGYGRGPSGGGGGGLLGGGGEGVGGLGDSGGGYGEGDEGFGSGGGPGGYPGGGLAGGFGGGPTTKQPLEVIHSRRILNEQLQALLLAMAGSLDPDRPGEAIASRAKDDGRQRADELVANLRALAETVNQPANGARARYVAALEEQREELEKWLNRYRPEPREPAGEAGEAGNNADQPGEGDVAGGNPPAGGGAGDDSDSSATGG